MIGAGPAGIYAARCLVEQSEIPVTVDLLERLPTPFGLVRHGIAPDHLKMRSLRNALQKVLEHERVRFIGNVDVGVDLTLLELRRYVDAVIYAFGAAGDRRIGIDGEDLPGVLSATAFVSWYTGHPDADRGRIEEALSRARKVVVVGVGNVALDVARVLSRAPAELEHTDMPQHVLDVLAAAPVETVTVLGRRGPAQASFTYLELRELGKLARATVLVDPAQLHADAEPGDRMASRNVATLRGWVENVVRDGHVSLRLRFFARPVRLHGTDRVTGIEVERTEVGADGDLIGTGHTDVIPADLVIRSVGYRGYELPGVPLDQRSGTVLHQAGRVLRGSRFSVAEYVVGWIKRGPHGVVGTNRSDAQETVASLLADVAAGVVVAHPPIGDLVTCLIDHGVEPVLLRNWSAIDAAEQALGGTHGRPRTTMHEWSALLTAARAAAP